ncbi:thymidylate synthase [uncultured Gilvimarinus sp.]|uniref:thymidylate synthase n=1 Tax=uncultured Gilvimarinus sp. TaxID=1689143 RepID=UPI0030D9B2F8
MYIREDSLDDLLKSTFEKFADGKLPLVKATKGNSYELLGVLLELTNPRSRLSRSEIKGTPYSCIGELAWYLSRSNTSSDIEYYLHRYRDSSEDDGKIHGAYGPRFFSMHGRFNQIENIVSLLRRKPTSRRAVIQLFDASDITQDFKDIPCTANIQFFLRDSKLNMMVNMRSNDVYFGLPHDVFCFTMLQEIIACRLGVKLGVYKHSVGSLHLYEDKITNINSYIQEGWQRQVPMPHMRCENIEKQIEHFIDVEKRIRSGGEYDSAEDSISDSYWKDLLILLKVFSKRKTNDLDLFLVLKGSLYTEMYKSYVDKYIDSLGKESCVR